MKRNGMRPPVTLTCIVLFMRHVSGVVLGSKSPVTKCPLVEDIRPDIWA